MAAASRKSRSNASDTAADAWQHAVRLLARRDRSEHEVRTALATRGTSSPVIEGVVCRLRDLRYVDDRRLAAHVAERAVHRGFGSERVRAELTAKGIGEDVLDAVLAAAFADELALAREVCTRRFGSDPLLPAQRGKAARFLHGRGFPDAIVLAILDEGC